MLSIVCKENDDDAIYTKLLMNHILIRFHSFNQAIQNKNDVIRNLGKFYNAWEALKVNNNFNKLIISRYKWLRHFKANKLSWVHISSSDNTDHRSKTESQKRLVLVPFAPWYKLTIRYRVRWPLVHSYKIINILAFTNEIYAAANFYIYFFMKIDQIF